MRETVASRVALGLILAGTATILWAAASGGGVGQQNPLPLPPPMSDRKSFTISDNVNLVVLDVSVKDAKGGYVTGLSKDAFQIFDDGRPREITEFQKVDTPVTVGLIVDDSGSMVRKRPEVVLAGLAFAKESNKRDEFFVVNFNNSVVMGLPPRLKFTDDLQTLRSALYYGRPEGQTALYDAIATGLKHMELSPQQKRVLIVVSDGGDNVSKTSLAALMQLIESSRATIYTIGLYDRDDNDRNPSVLKNFAKATGGEFFEPPTLDDVIPVFHKISSDIRNRYTMAYVPDMSDKRLLRTIRVLAQADGRRLNVRTRTLYSIAPSSQLVAQETKHSQERSR